MASSLKNNSNHGLQKWVAGIEAQIVAGYQKELYTFRLARYMIEKQSIYTSYIQPFIGVLSLIVLCVAAHLLFKLKIRALVSDVFFLCSTIKCIPKILLVPLNIVFTQYYDAAAPMLYPWCFIYILLSNTLTKLTQFISLNWNMLLAVNRYCSVYYPFKTRVWFSSTRNKIYISTILLISTLLILVLNFHAFSQDRHNVVQDPKGNGRYIVYPACSIHDHSDLESIDFTFRMIEAFVTMSCTIVLGVLNAILLVKLWKMKNQQLNSFEGSAVFVKKNSSRLLMMNKIFCLVITGVLLVEIPHVIIFIVVIYEGLTIKVHGGEGQALPDITSHVSILVIYDFFAPFDIFLFLISSQKVRDHLKAIVCFKRSSQ